MLYRDELIKSSIFSAVAGSIAGGIFFGGVYLQRVIPQPYFGSLVLAAAFLIPSLFYNFQYLDMARLTRRQKWTINALEVGFQRIKATLNESITHSSEELDRADLGKKWPWGEHHTEMLGHLEAAATKFWTLYDKGDPSTAPLNEMVADWLQTERGVSKDKARAIASILRADGLPTGPRR